MIPAQDWEYLDSETLKARPTRRLHCPELPSVSQLPREPFPGRPGDTDDPVSPMFLTRAFASRAVVEGQCMASASIISRGRDLCSPQTPRALPRLRLRLLKRREALTAPHSPTVQPSTCTALAAALLLEAAGEGKPLNPRFVLSSGGSIIPSLAPRQDQEPGNDPAGGTNTPAPAQTLPPGDQSATWGGGATAQKPNPSRPALSDSSSHQSERGQRIAPLPARALEVAPSPARRGGRGRGREAGHGAGGGSARLLLPSPQAGLAGCNVLPERGPGPPGSGAAAVAAARPGSAAHAPGTGRLLRVKSTAASFSLSPAPSSLPAAWGRGNLSDRRRDGRSVLAEGVAQRIGRVTR